MTRQNAPTINRTAEPVNAGSEQERIEALAYQLWLERGAPQGSPEVDWYRAEEELKGGHRTVHRAA